MSIGHSYLTEADAEKLVHDLDRLQANISNTYEENFKSPFARLEQQIDGLRKVTEANEATTRKLQSIAEQIGRLRQLSVSKFLELEAQTQAIQQEATKVTELEQRKVALEEKRLTVETWQAFILVVVAFLTGLVFPILLQAVGIKPAP